MSFCRSAGREDRGLAPIGRFHDSGDPPPAVGWQQRIEANVVREILSDYEQVCRG